MTKRRLFIAVAVLVLVALAGGVIFFLLQDVPDVTEADVSTACVQSDTAEACVQFPTISGDNLLGQAVTYPADFSGDTVLAVVPFDRDQQVVANTWLPFVQEIAGEYPEFAYYNIPVFPDIESGFRVLARAGLILVIQDEHLREITATVFLDNRDEFLNALAIPDVEDVQILLMERDGTVLWRETGEFTEAKGDALLQAVENLSME
ncbi:MAG: hypothetical protein RLP44_30485 [Aggregatilineales bacterium]